MCGKKASVYFVYIFCIISGAFLFPSLESGIGVFVFLFISFEPILVFAFVVLDSGILAFVFVSLDSGKQVILFVFQIQEDKYLFLYF